MQHAVKVLQTGDDVDAATLACGIGRGIGRDAAGVLDAVAGHQTHHAPIVHQAIRLDAAAVVDHATLNGIGRLRRQDHQATGRHHRVAILHIGRDSGGRDQDMGQRVIGFKLKAVGFTRGQHNAATLGHHHAEVAHLRGQQRDVTAELGIQLTVVDDVANGTGAVEVVVAAHEIGIADAVGRGQQTAHIHTRPWREINAIRVLQEHRPIGFDLTKNLARVAVLHPVQSHTVRTGLVELHRGLRTHIEALPIQHRFVRALFHRQHGTRLRHLGRTCSHLSAGR